MCNKNRAKEYYKNNRDVILNRSKEYYINNKQSILGHLKNKYQSLTKKIVDLLTLGKSKKYCHFC